MSRTFNFFKVLQRHYHEHPQDNPFFPRDDSPALIEVFGDRQERMQMIRLYLDVEGELIGGDGSSDIFNPENLDLWDKYIEAHNNRDLDAIAEMNIDSTQQMGSFKIIGPDGSVIDGSDTHIEFLKGWFETENPTWNTWFSYTMKVENQPGEWVISGAQVKKTVNGEEVTSYDIIDAYIEEGKIGAFWVFTRAEPQQ